MANRSQLMRLANATVLGPAMLFAATGRRPPLWLSTALMIFGAGTILVNGLDYLGAIKKRS